MKKFYALLLLVPFFVFSQNNKENYDYFVQFNTNQFAKKVNIDSLFNHKLFKSFNKQNSDFKLKDFVSLLDKSKNATIHGTFKDSISYTQITLPIVDEKKTTELIQRMIQKNQASKNDKIVKKSNYSMYSPANEDYSLAWNKKVLVIYVSYDTKPKNYYRNNPYGEAYEVEETVYDESYDEEAIEVEEVKIESTEIIEEDYDAVKVVEVEAEEMEEDYDDYYDDEYFKKMREENEKRIAEERKLKHERQSDEIAKMFKKGLDIPTSSKVNKEADISAWMDYQALTGKMTSLYAFFGKMTPNAIPYELTYSVKGMNMDMFFENDKARVTQTLEYTEPLANVMKKVISRKPNENIYKYFPKNEPLGYFTYHMSTAEILKNYPAIIEQSFSALPIEKEGIDIVMDLMTTIIDEEATATLMDGDFAMFFHGMEKFNYTFKTVEYDDDYEEIEVEKTIEKNKPVFSLILTSTHPKMAEKLIKLGIKKEVLVQENGNYKIKGTNEFGDMFIMKEGDVLVFTNGINYLAKGSPSDFSKRMAKESADYYFSGNFNIQDFIKSYMLVEDFGRDTAKALRVADQFRNIEMKSSNKLDGNTMKVEMNLNSNFSNKNIILQTLDLIDYMN
jgi:signal peptidase I